MKLSKMELEALASRIKKDLEESAGQAQKALNEVQDKANDKMAKAILKEIKCLSPEAKKLVKDQSNIELQDVVESLRKTQTKVKGGKGYYRSDGEILNTLIIAQIDCVDLETLIEKVKKQFIV